MPKIVISGIAHAYADDPGSDEPITDNDALALLHGLCSSEVCSEYFEEPELINLGIDGGRLRFVHDKDSSSLRITTSYNVPRELSDEEQKLLIEATEAQWSDGLGSGSFQNHRGEVLSASLAVAILNSDPSIAEDMGDLFVEASPYIEDSDIQIEFIADGNADDDLINDIVTAAESGEASAQVELGRLHETGDGVEQNEQLAFEMYSRAAEQGDVVGKTLLGYCFIRGYGAEKDYTRAIELVQAGVEDGFPMAMHIMGECYAEGTGVTVDEQAAIELYRKGAEIGDPGCMAELGDCLEFGKGIEKDLNEALRYYQESLECGFDAVQEAIDRVESELGIS